MDVVPLIPSQEAVDAAWEHYRALAAAATERPALLLDRAQFQNLTRAEASFRRAFLASDAPRPVLHIEAADA